MFQSIQVKFFSSFFLKPWFYWGCGVLFYWVLFCGWVSWGGSKEDVQDWNILFFSLEKLRRVPAHWFEFVQNRNRQTGERIQSQQNRPTGGASATEKRQKITEKKTKSRPREAKKSRFRKGVAVVYLYVLPKHSIYLIYFITFVKWK